MSKKDKNEVAETLDTTTDTALFNAIESLENLDTEIEDILDENGTLDKAMYTFLQCFNDDDFNGQSHLQWEINFTSRCNALGIERKQKNVKLQQGNKKKKTLKGKT